MTDLGPTSRAGSGAPGLHGGPPPATAGGQAGSRRDPTLGLAVGVAVVLPDGRRFDVGVRAGPGATVADLTAALADATGAPALRERPLHIGGRALRPTLVVTDAGIIHGSVVGLGAPVPESRPAPATAIAGERQVAVVGGAHAGAVIAMAAGSTVVVGRSRDADLVLDDGEASRRHLAVTALGGGAAGGDGPGPCAEVEDLGATNGVGLDGHLLASRTVILDGAVLAVGASALAVRRAPVATSVLEVSPTPGRVSLNRPPRIAPTSAVRTLVVPVEPETPPRRRMPLIAALLPLLFGVVIVSFIGFSPFLLFVLLSPVMIIGTAVSDRRSGRSDHKRQLGEYRAALEQLDVAVIGAVADDEMARRAADPDPAMVAAIACGPTARLWERRPTDPDFLRLRVGLADRPAGITLDRGARRRAAHLGAADPGAERPQPVAHLVPVALDLAPAGVVGLAGPRSAALALARATLAGLAALHRPDDVRLAVATGADEADDWAWAGWLPHVGRPSGAGRRLAAGRVEVEALVGELAGLVEERSANRRQLLTAGPPPGDKVVLVLDGARRLRAVPGIAGLLADGPEQGVYAVCIDLDEPSLPSECRATAVSGPPDAAGAPRWTVRQPDGVVVDEVLVDGVDVPLADGVARALGPVDDLGGALGRGELPDTVRYLDLVAMTDPTAADVVASWATVPGGRSTRALLGVGPDGPLAVDLAADGPHALVAGTTGSGKSELLQTLVASLALANRPDQLQVVLVDYKGGAAFAECAELPHCAGLITDLDGHLVHRALASLTAELKRREVLLAAVGASNLEAFWNARPDTVLPRLVIVIDEFASLVEEVPDFVKGVVGIGMRGRSLGVHVVLATQRPGGVVTADLRANVNLRICLRVADPQESTDVVDAPDAARIPTGRPGRAYVRLGSGGRPVAVQAARIGGRRPARPDEDAPPDATVDAVCVAVGPAPMVPAPVGGAVDDDEEGTDLAVLVAAVREAAAVARIALPRSPWLEALPDVVLLQDLGRPPASAGAGVGAPATAGGVAVGMADLPAEQRRDVLTVDLERTGSLLVVGGPRSGRSTVLRTLAASLAATHGPAALHLHAIDGGNRALTALETLPQVGAVVAVDDAERVDRLLLALTEEVTARQARFAADGVGSLAEHRELQVRSSGPDGPLPMVVLLVDKLEAFQAAHRDRDAGRAIDLLDGLLRDGPSVGVCPVVATDRSGYTSRLASAMEHRLLLRQSDREDWTVVGVPRDRVPGALPPGRCLAGPDLVEAQVALLVADPAAGAQAAAVARIGEAARATYGEPPAGRRPRHVDPLPAKVDAATVDRLRRRRRPAGPGVTTVGVGGDDLGPVDLDLVDVGPGWAVVGPPRSGRSTTLAGVVDALSGRTGGELPVVLLTPRPSPLRDLAGEAGVLAALSGAEIDTELPGLLDELGEGPLALVVDDAELVADGGAARELERFLRGARDRGRLLLVGATTDDVLASRYRGWLADVRRSRSGLLLRPTGPADGDVFDLRLPRGLGAGWPAGRGVLVTRGRAESVQVTAR